MNCDSSPTVFFFVFFLCDSDDSKIDNYYKMLNADSLNNIKQLNLISKQKKKTLPLEVFKYRLNKNIEISNDERTL